MRRNNGFGLRAILLFVLVASVAGSCTNTTSQARRALCPDPAPIGKPDGELTDIASTAIGPGGISPSKVSQDSVPYLYYSSDESGQFQIYRIRSGRIEEDTVEPAGFSKEKLTDSDRDQGSSNVTPFASSGGYVVFSSNRTGNYEIFVMRTDGSGQTRLTNTAGNEIGPVMSPDGRAIAFTSDCYGNEDVFVISTNGQSIKRLTASGEMDSAPDWSPDGSQIAYKSDADGLEAIYLADPDGQNPRRLTANTYPESAPAFSPDGRSIAFQAKKGRYWQIHISSLDGTDERVISDGAGNDSRPRWSYDGSKIYFVSDRDGHDAIYTMNADGSAVTRVVGNSYEARSPSETLVV
jgi:Tol biopolymer transport system component